MEDNWYTDITDWIASQHPNKGIYSNETNNMTYNMTDLKSLASYKRNIFSLINATKDDRVPLILGNQAYLYNDKLTPEAESKLFFPKYQCTNAQGKYPSLDSMIHAMNAYNATIENTARDND